MAEFQVHKKADTIDLKSNSKKEFFLLHGYTGSPTDFNGLGKYLNRRFNANVKIIRLKGHGERIENIDSLTYKDFFLQSEEELKKEIKKGREIIVGGISIGSLIALNLAAKYPVKGVFSISVPYKNKFLPGIISFLEPIIIKKHWKKPIGKHEKRTEDNSFFYDINLRGFRVIKQAKKELTRILHEIKVPSLIIHVQKDNIFHIKGAYYIRDKIKSSVNEFFIFNPENKSSHNPFFSPSNEKLNKVIGDFVEENKLFSIR